MSAAVTAVSSCSTNTSNQRSGRTNNRDKKTSSSKTNTNASNSGNTGADNQDKNHSDGSGSASKLQPTAEQIRIADLMNDKLDDSDLSNKVKQIMEVTGTTRDEAVVALHDCDSDAARAINMIFEGDTNIESEWQTTGKKKKPQSKAGSGENSEHAKSNGNKDHHARTEETNGDGKVSGGNRTSDRTGRGGKINSNKMPRGAPPRMQRAAQAQSQSQRGAGSGHGHANAVNNRDRERRPIKDINTSLKDQESEDNTFNNQSNRRNDGLGNNSRPSEGRSEMRGEFRSNEFRSDSKRVGVGRGGSRGGINYTGPPGSGTSLGSTPASSMSGTGRTGAGRGGSTFVAPNRTRTFQNRGLQNEGGFPASIDTWTNSTAEQTGGKQPVGDVSTMPVGNWSDIAKKKELEIATIEDWNSEEDNWDSNAMNETKVFTPSCKLSLNEKDREFDLSNVSSNNTNQTQSSMDFTALFPRKSNTSVDPSGRSQQPTMSSILRGTTTSNASVNNTGAALLQQLQQSNSVTQAPVSHSQYNLQSSFNKQATESLKSLVGINVSNQSSGFSTSNTSILTDSHGLDTDVRVHAANKQQQRIKTARQSKIPETAVEMPSSNDSSMAALDVSFGELQFGVGSDTSAFTLANDAAFQDTLSQMAKQQAKKNVSSNQGNSLLGTVPDAYRSASQHQPHMSDVSNKTINVLQQLTNDSLLSNKSQQNVGSYNVNQQQKVAGMDVTNVGKNVNNKFSNMSQQGSLNNELSSTYKSSYDNSGYNNSNNYSAVTTSYSYSQPSSAYANYTSNFANTNSSSHGGVSKLNIDNASQQNKHAYDHLSNATLPNAIGGGNVSNTTSTTNVLKTSLSATGKGGVQNVTTQQPILGPHHYMTLGNAIFPFHPAAPYSHPADPYSASQGGQQREHNVNTYAPQLYNSPQDIKYTRGSESEVTNQVATSQAPSQSHNQPIAPLPPGYGFYIPSMNMVPGMNMQQFYSAPLAYSVPPGSNTHSQSATHSSAFPKPTTGYGSHTGYSSGYDPLSGVSVPQDYTKSSYGGPLGTSSSAPQQHKNIVGATSSDALGNAGIHKPYAPMNKNYDKQGFTSSTPASFNLTSGGTASSATGSAYPPYILSQPLHHNLQSDPNQVSGPRSISQTHNRSTGPQAPAKSQYYQWGNN